jgi:quercetin dioxygenase-like cupin family protein
MHDPKTSFVDARGTITNLVVSDESGAIGGVQLIESKAGSVRANHWHREDSHALHVLSGRVVYLEREHGVDDVPKRTVHGPGETIFTGPNVDHSLLFPVDTVMISVSQFRRGKDPHDAIPLADGTLTDNDTVVGTDISEDDINFVADGEVLG